MKRIRAAPRSVCEDSPVIQRMTEDNSKLEDQETGSHGSSGYDSCTLSPSTPGSSNSPGTGEDIQHDNEEIKLDNEERTNSPKAELKKKKGGKTFPVLIEMTKVDDKEVSTPPVNQNEDPDDDSSSDNEMSNIPLSQRMTMLKKRKSSLIFRKKQSKADREILNEMENPKPSTSAPLWREIERIRRGFIGQTDEKSTALMKNTSFRRFTPRKRQINGKIVTTPLIYSLNSPIDPLPKKKIGPIKTKSGTRTAPKMVSKGNDPLGSPEVSESEVKLVLKSNAELKPSEETILDDKVVDQTIQETQEEIGTDDTDMTTPSTPLFIQVDTFTKSTENLVPVGEASDEPRKRKSACQDANITTQNPFVKLTRIEETYTGNKKMVSPESKKEVPSENNETDSEITIAIGTGQDEETEFACTTATPAKKAKISSYKTKKSVQSSKTEAKGTEVKAKVLSGPRTLVLKLERLTNAEIVLKSSKASNSTPTVTSTPSNVDESKQKGRTPRKRKISEDDESEFVDVELLDSSDSETTDKKAVVPMSVQHKKLVEEAASQKVKTSTSKSVSNKKANKSRNGHARKASSTNDSINSDVESVSSRNNNNGSRNSTPNNVHSLTTDNGNSAKDEEVIHPRRSDRKKKFKYEEVWLVY